MLAPLWLLTLPALAQNPVTAPAVPAPAESSTPSPPLPRPGTVRVRLQTSEGAIVIELEKERAPITTANFLRYVDQKRLDGATFYRAVKLADAPLLGLVQGGVRNDPKRVLPPIRHEPTSATGLSHTDGAISMARVAPGTASGDFFITVGALTSFDSNSAQPGDNLGFAAFGRVVEGMDVVHRILAAPTSPTLGEGVMKGQMIAKPIRIIAAQRVK